MKSEPFDPFVYRAITDADLTDWAQRVWAAVEYTGDGVKTIREFLGFCQPRSTQTLIDEYYRGYSEAVDYLMKREE